MVDSLADIETLSDAKMRISHLKAALKDLVRDSRTRTDAQSQSWEQTVRYSLLPQLKKAKRQVGFQY